MATSDDYTDNTVVVASTQATVLHPIVVGQKVEKCLVFTTNRDDNSPDTEPLYNATVTNNRANPLIMVIFLQSERTGIGVGIRDDGLSRYFSTTGNGRRVQCAQETE